MARKAKSKALYTVKVWPVNEEDVPLISNFTSELEAYEFAKTLKKRTDIADVCMGPGYKIYDTAEEALETFMMWMR